MSQLPPPNRIPIDQWILRCKSFYDAHPSEESRTVNHAIKEMFELYNDKYLPRENGMYCSTCCNRVYRRLKHEYEKITNNN